MRKSLVGDWGVSKLGDFGWPSAADEAIGVYRRKQQEPQSL